MRIKQQFIAVISLICAMQVSAQSFNDFGDNPGELTSNLIVNSNKAPLVVLLHGCAQDAVAFAEQSGFTELAKQHQFNLLLPQQSDKNNVKRCFNWFSQADINKDQGETLSLKNVILSAKQHTESEQVYIVGLSAGGAMADVLLSHYPSMFSAGAIIAGVPFGCANDLIKAIACMRTGPNDPQGVIQADATYQGSYPNIIVWTGTKDAIVAAVNADVIAKRWAHLHKVKTSTSDAQGDMKMTFWPTADKATVTLIKVAEKGHGIFVNPDEKMGGTSGPFFIENSLSTAQDIVSRWQLDLKK
ncbi:extracellular catalytic domain type 1 short-chain-length polyhydroxyalkanoate depolymerase [Thalassotalea agarivorans]|uniref:Esterase, PHB depolymerase family n=1 Tax=Thalassotalea agarivorans TaxID=349064 RepID=A0A1I0CQ13_THASX|nr:PHB depolymerase family esterase [Thalassotalea agarivorans]SET21371.1 esterase, PHB depolymerase family [Thalassotalea agarivorans]